MKSIKKSFCVFLSVLLLALLFALPFPASAASNLDLRVLPFENESTVIKAWFNTAEGDYDLFLPSGANRSALRVHFTGGETLTAGETVLHDGDVTDIFAADTVQVSLGGTDYTVRCFVSETIPAVFIQTESGSLNAIHADKEHREPGVITTVEDGVVSLNAVALSQIKGRGNATWGAPKKPYNIKFDKKTSLLGMPKAKKWTLLASYYDPTLLRNPTAFEMAAQLGLPFGSAYRHADLYINGEYLGNYLFCESVEIGDNRVEIHDLSKDNEAANPGIDLETLPVHGTGKNGAVEGSNVKGSKKWVEMPNEPENITGGYLLECEFAVRYDAEISGFVTNGGQCVVIKEPEYASKAEVDYISAFYGAAEEALRSESGYNAAGKHYSEYFDVTALAKMYLLEEFSIDVDAGQSSCYLYLDRDADKLVASPPWDFDHANGDPADSRYGLRIADPSIWYANSLNYTRSWMGNGTNAPTLFKLAYRHEDFRDSVTDAWQDYNERYGAQGLTDFVSASAGELTATGAMNAIRWNYFSEKPSVQKNEGYLAMVNGALGFIAQRTQYLNKGFAPNAAMLYYENNGGTGLVFEKTISVIGDTRTVLALDASGEPLQPPEAQMYFTGWNTAADGSGTGYQPGDSITLNGRTTTLYAQWKNKTSGQIVEEYVTEKNRSFWQKLRDFFQRIRDFFARLFSK